MKRNGTVKPQAIRTNSGTHIETRRGEEVKLDLRSPPTKRTKQGNIDSLSAKRQKGNEGLVLCRPPEKSRRSLASSLDEPPKGEDCFSPATQTEVEIKVPHIDQLPSAQSCSFSQMEVELKVAQADQPSTQSYSPQVTQTDAETKEPQVDQRPSPQYSPPTAQTDLEIKVPQLYSLPVQTEVEIKDSQWPQPKALDTTHLLLQRRPVGERSAETPVLEALTNEGRPDPVVDDPMEVVHEQPFNFNFLPYIPPHLQYQPPYAFQPPCVYQLGPAIPTHHGCVNGEHIEEIFGFGPDDHAQDHDAEEDAELPQLNRSMSDSACRLDNFFRYYGSDSDDDHRGGFGISMDDKF